MPGNKKAENSDQHSTERNEESESKNTVCINKRQTGLQTLNSIAFVNNEKMSTQSIKAYPLKHKISMFSGGDKPPLPRTWLTGKIPYTEINEK